MVFEGLATTAERSVDAGPGLGAASKVVVGPAGGPPVGGPSLRTAGSLVTKRGSLGRPGVVGSAAVCGPDEMGEAGAELTVCSPVVSSAPVPVEATVGVDPRPVWAIASAGSGSTIVDGGSISLPGTGVDGRVEVTGAPDPLPDAPGDSLPERPVGPRRAPARRPTGAADSGSAGETSRRRPSASARRRARSAWASSMLEEWLFTPIPRTWQRSRASLLVSPSSRASS